MTSPEHLLASIVTRIRDFDSRELEFLTAVVDGLERLHRREERREAQCGAGPSHAKDTQRTNDWPRAPLHRLEGKGAFMVTAGTLHKEHHFRSTEALDYLEAHLLEKAHEYDWHIEAWAVFSNHYHFVGQALSDAESLRPMLNHLHGDTARWINGQEGQAERQVWYNFWDTKLTYSKSYQARLKYVHWNAVRHGIVKVPNQYPWCSAGWFERTATPAQVKTIYSFKTDKIKVMDDFEPMVVMR